MPRSTPEVAALERIAAALENHSRFDRLELHIARLENRIMSLATDLQEKLDAINVNTTDMAAQVARIREVLTTIKDQLANGITPEEGAALVAQADAVLASTETLETDLVNTGNE